MKQNKKRTVNENKNFQEKAFMLACNQIFSSYSSKFVIVNGVVSLSCPFNSQKSQWLEACFKLTFVTAFPVEFDMACELFLRQFCCSLLLPNQDADECKEMANQLAESMPRWHIYFVCSFGSCSPQNFFRASSLPPPIKIQHVALGVASP